MGSSLTLNESMHKVALQVDEGDPKVMNMPLINVQNLYGYHIQKGETVEIEVVAYGPVLQMYDEGKLPVADCIVTMSLEIDGLRFSACGNTHWKMNEKPVRPCHNNLRRKLSDQGV